MSGKSSEKQTSTTQFTPQQSQIMSQLNAAYSPYVGSGVLGGLSDLEQNALNMLKSADIWGPLSSAGTGLLTGTTGAKTTTPEEASKAFTGAVEEPVWYNWQTELLPQVKEAYAGPGYWGSAKAEGVRRSAEDINSWLGGQRANWMWNADQANKAIEEAKAGRALSALGAVPSSLLGWTSGLSSMGRQTQELLNSITDPQVLSVLQTLLNIAPRGETTTRATSTPSTLGQIGQIAQLGSNLLNLGTGIGSALGGIGGGGYQPNYSLGYSNAGVPWV